MEFVGKCLLLGSVKKKILAVGDLHIGYEQALNDSGVFVSREMFEEMIKYFDGLFGKIGQVDEIVLLGDVKHVFGKIMKQEWNDVLGLFDYLLEKCERVIVIKGNHDAVIEPIVNKKGRVIVKDCYILGECCFMHGDRQFLDAFDKKIKTWVIGHGHPAVKISEPRGSKVEKYKCFLVGRFKRKKVVILPSFQDYPEGSDPRENDLKFAWEFDLEKFGVYVVSDGNFEVLNFGKLGKLD